MTEIKVSEIKIAGNPRKDFGDLSELIESIKANGIIQPLIVTKDHELVAGERRLRAAKEIGLETVPIVVQDYSEVQKFEIKLIENMQRKDLNPIEEGEYFSTYLKETKKSAEHLAKKIGKPVDYIHRRMALNKIDDKVKDALVRGHIKLGHAVLISKFTKDKHAGILKRIETENISVDTLDEALQNEKDYAEIEDASFDTKECQSCEHNCSVQRTLAELGNSMAGKCLRPSCFAKKQKEIFDSIKADFKKRNVKILKENEYPSRMDSVYGYEDDPKVKAKTDPFIAEHPDKFAVSISQYGDAGRIRFTLYTSYKESTRNATGHASLSEGAKDSFSQDRLETRMLEYKRRLLAKTSKTLVKPSTYQVKALALYSLLDSAPYNSEDRNAALVMVNKNIFGAPETLLDEAIALFSNSIITKMANDFGSLQRASQILGFDIEKHFTMDEDYLKMHTKDQLVELAKELKIQLGDSEKKGELIEVIMKGWKHGSVPKQFVTVGVGLESRAQEIHSDDEDEVFEDEDGDEVDDPESDEGDDAQ